MDGPIDLTSPDAEAKLAQSSKPLVVLLDGKNCDAEWGILKDVATVAHINAQSKDDIPEKVYNEAVGIFMFHTLNLEKADLEKFKSLRVIGRLGVGYNNIDIKTAGELGVQVCNSPDYGVEEIADLTMCMILDLHRKMHWYANMVKEGRKLHGVEEIGAAGRGATRVRGRTLGIIGLGNSGIAVAVRAKAFGLKVLFYDPYLRHSVEKALVIKRAMTLEELLAKTDCLSLHCNLTKDNHHFINEKTLRQMKRGSFIVNTARGGLIDEHALARALKDGHIAAAALDVHEKEPFTFTPDQPLHDAPNILCTPHSAFYSDQSVIEMRETAAKDVAKALTGQPMRNCVNTQFLKK